LRAEGLYENTLIIFLSDNGAAPTEVHGYPGTSREWVERNSDNRFENMGRRGSRISIGPAWSVASNTPLRYFKGTHAGGGIRVPLIVTGPGVARAGQIQPIFAHAMDIAPTLLELAGVSHPQEHQGREVLPMLGTSMAPFLAGASDFVRGPDQAVGWELLGRRAIRQGRWKATWLDGPLGSNDWQLFDVMADVSERNDLADSNPQKLSELIQLWEEYADQVGVVLPVSIPSFED
jgi:arylsulfatase